MLALPWPRRTDARSPIVTNDRDAVDDEVVHESESISCKNRGDANPGSVRRQKRVAPKPRGRERWCRSRPHEGGRISAQNRWGFGPELPGTVATQVDTTERDRCAMTAPKLTTGAVYSPLIMEETRTAIPKNSSPPPIPSIRKSCFAGIDGKTRSIRR
jgi:hypothetical protein